MPAKSVMKCTGRPHGGESRGSSDENGPLASDILRGGLESPSPPALVSELSKGEQYSRPIQVSDVSAVFSLLGGSSPSKENDPSASYPSGDFRAVFSGNCSQGPRGPLGGIREIRQNGCLCVTKFVTATLPTSILVGRTASSCRKPAAVCAV